jgi:LPS O-antigen subunit length determinant protein (WzzB/FepE family)
MTQDSTKSSNSLDELDFRQTFKMLRESKKVIFSSILIFVIAAILYSFSLKPTFTSSVLIEIGHYERLDGTEELIETPSNLISALKVLHKKHSLSLLNQNLLISSIEDRLINFETTSKSLVKNENLLTKMINFIFERHSNNATQLIKYRKDQVSNEIDLIDSKISFLKANELSKKIKELSIFEDSIVKLSNELAIIDLEISQIEKLIINDTNNSSLLKNTDKMLDEREATSPTLEKTIFNYNAQIANLSIKKYASNLEIKRLNNQLKLLENDAIKSDVIFNLEQEQKILKNNFQMLMNQTQIKTKSVTNIETKTVEAKIVLIILLGLLFGFFIGVFLVFFKNMIH